MSKLRRALCWVLFPSLAAASSMQTSAQSAPEAVASLDEVVITSRKLGAEALQRAPIAATAISMEALERGQYIDLREVARLAPNVQLETSAAFPGFANFTIRGLTLNNSLRTLDPAVSVVFDGLAYGDPLGMVLDTFDVESIEVLRGPQGILVGRNSTGGAVVLRTRRPAEEFGIHAAARLGNLGRFDQSLSIEGPVADTLRAKLAVMHRKGDGPFKDRNGGSLVAAPGNPGGTLANPRVKPPVREDVWTARGIVVWEPTENLTIDLIGEYIDGEYGGNASRILLARAPLTTGLGYTPPGFGFDVDHDGRGFSTLETKRGVVEINWETGAGLLTSVSAYRDLDYLTNGDNDGTPFAILHFPDNTADSEQFTQELRFVTDIGSRMKLMVGGYYSTLEMNTLENRIVNLVLAGAAPPAATIRQQNFWTQDSTIYAFFANADWKATEKLTLSAGMRYTDEKKDIDIGLLRVCAGGTLAGCPTTSVREADDWSDVDWRFAIDYQLSEGIFSYASYTTGFRSGAFNGRATTALSVRASQPEKAETIEFGLKSEFFNRRLRANLALFTTDFTDVQATLIGPDTAQTILNAADATIKGVEFELAVLAAEGLTLEGVVGYTDAKYDRFDGLDLTGDRVPDPDLAKRLDFPRVPKLTYTASANYNFSIPNVGGEFNARVQYSWRDNVFTDLVNTPQTEVPSYGLLDASVEYSPTENLTFRLYGTNLTKEKMWEISIPTPFAWIVNGGIGRTYGLEASFRY